MKEELLKNLMGIIDYVKQGVDFTIEQAPLFIQEYLKYHLSFHIFWEVIIIISFTLSIWYLIYLVKYTKNISYDVDLIFIPSLLIVVSLIAFCINSVYLLKIYFAPRVYLVESLLSLLGGK